MKIDRLIGTWFGCGLSPAAPGTVGSAAALAIAIALHAWLGWGRWEFLALTAAATPVGIWAATGTARGAGRKDPGIVVVDEVLGQWLTLAGAQSFGPATWALAFGLFRLFDIVKPWPVRRLESLPNGTGIVADGVGAGVYAALILYIAGWLQLV